MAEIPSNIKKKIDSLKFKTIKNGATFSEQESAQKKINDLIRRYSSPQPAKSYVGNKSVFTIDSSLQAFKDSYSNGSIESKILVFDWDTIAKEALSTELFFLYLEKTSDLWESHAWFVYKLAPPEGKQSMSLEEYRRKCYRAFSSIVKDYSVDLIT